MRVGCQLQFEFCNLRRRVFGGMTAAATAATDDGGSPRSTLAGSVFGDACSIAAASDLSGALPPSQDRIEVRWETAAVHHGSSSHPASASLTIPNNYHRWGNVRCSSVARTSAGTKGSPPQQKSSPWLDGCFEPSTMFQLVTRKLPNKLYPHIHYRKRRDLNLPGASSVSSGSASDALRCAALCWTVYSCTAQMLMFYRT